MLAETVVTAAAGALGKTAIDIVKGLGEVRLDEPIQQAIYNASRQYVRRYDERHGQLKVLGMSEPVSLEETYTAVRILDAAALRQFATRDALEEQYRDSGQRGFSRRDCATEPGIDVANQKQYLTVLGGPGIGKSTYLRKTGLEALKGQQGGYQHRVVPVFLDLKGFDRTDIDIEAKIAAEFEICGFPNAAAYTQKALQQGKLLVLLDGLDEVPSQTLSATIETIRNFVAKYDKNRFIASCRIAAYHGYFQRFTDVAIAEFDDAQIEQFIHNWFRSELDRQKGTAQKCWELLQREEYASAKELAQTPLLLTFLCLVYDRSQILPPKRSELYGKALNIILEEWAAQKRIARDPIYQGLHPGLEKELLAEIAYRSFAANELFLDRQELERSISAFLADTLDASPHLDGNAVLKAIEVQQGILVERAEQTYSFSHLTLQEYLTAAFVVNENAIEQVRQLVKECATEARWREVFLLVAGLMGRDVNQLFLALEKEAISKIDTPRLRELLAWMAWIEVEAEHDFASWEMRAWCGYLASDLAFAIASDLAFAIASARASARAIAIASASASASAFAIAIASASAIARERQKDRPRIVKFKSEISSEQLAVQIEEVQKLVPADDSLRAWEAYITGLKKLFDETIDQTQGILAITDEEANKLADYFYLNKLMLDCKDAAIRVSKEAWGAIEARLLTISEES